jgi:Family of unknown function (DUF5398)
MFGLEGQKKKKSPTEFFFDLENELKDPHKLKEMRSRLEDRIQKIKEIMRTGEDQEEYARFSLLLNGYSSFLKVLSRISSKKAK